MAKVEFKRVESFLGDPSRRPSMHKTAADEQGPAPTSLKRVRLHVAHFPCLCPCARWRLTITDGSARLLRFVSLGLS